MEKKPNYKGVWIALFLIVSLVVWIIYISLDRQEQKLEQLKIQIEQYEINRQNIDKKIQEFIDNPPEDGTDGSDGQSIKGNKGAGIKGDPGKSIRGQRGESGIGLSAYQLWLSIGNTGSVEDFLDDLRGEQGPPAELPQFYFNQDTGNFEMKNPGDLFPQIVIPKCAFEGVCLP